MTISIHPYLIARFKAVQAAFMYPGSRPPAMAMPNWGDLLNDEDTDSGSGSGSASSNKSNNWKKLLDEDYNDDDGEGGGGGTIRGNRGKNAQHAKAAMRKLTRAGGR